MSRNLRLAVAAAILLLFALCLVGLITASTLYPLFNQPANRTTAVTWPQLPQPTSTHPDWQGFTNPHTIHDVVLYDGYLWAATNGGVVVWDAQTGEAAKFTTEHGLAENVVTSTAVGPDGALWFGTKSGGLSRFDGTSWQTFTTAEGLPSNHIRDLAISVDGYVWAATDKGVAQYDGRKWFIHNRARSLLQLPDEDIRALAIAPDGITMWAATGQGAAHFNGTRWQPFPQVGSQAINDLQDIAITPDGMVWAASPGGLIRFDGRDWELFTSADGLESERIRQVTAVADNTIWVLYDNAQAGLTHFDASTNPPTAITTMPDQSKGITTYQSITPLPGSLAIAAPGQLLIQTGTTQQSFVPPVDLPHETLTDVAAAQDNVWLSGNQGLSQFDGTNWHTYTSADGLALNDVAALTTDLGGNLWLAYSDASQGVTFFDAANGRFQTNPCLTSGPPSASVRDGAQAADGTLWFATNNGLSQYDGQTWRTFTTHDGLPSNYVQTITVTPDGLVAVGTNQGLAIYDGNRWQTIFPDDTRLLTTDESGVIYYITADEIGKLDDGRSPIPNPPVSAVYDMLGSGGHLWLTAEEGVFWYDGRGWTSFDNSNSLPTNRARTLTQTEHGTLLVTTETNPEPRSSSLYGQYFVQHNYISAWDGTSWQTNAVPQGFGLPHPVVTDILVTDDDSVWFATLGGIASLAGDRWQTYTPHSGLPAAEVFSLAEAFGTVWGVTQAGLVQFAGDAGPRPWQTIPETQNLWPIMSDVTLIVDQEGDLWAGGGSHLMEYDGQSWQAHPLTPPEDNFLIRSLAIAPDGSIWAAGQAPDLADDERHFIGSWHDDGWAWQKLPVQSGFFAVDLMRFAPDGRLWLGNDNGLWTSELVDGRVTQLQPVPDSREATDLVFGADGDPLFSQRYQPAIMAVHNRERIQIPLIDAQQLYALNFADDGSLWVGTDQGAAQLKADGGWALFAVPKLADPPILTRITAVNDTIYLGTFSGQLLTYEDGSIYVENPILLSPSAGDVPISSILPRDDGSLWVSTFGTGIARRERNRWRLFAGSSPILTAVVNSLALTDDGTPWLATHQGIITQSQQDGSVICRFLANQPGEAPAAIQTNFGNQIWTVSEDKLWLGNEAGFERMGTLVLPITAVAPDGSIWVATHEGLVRHNNGRRQTISSETIPGEITSVAIAPDNSIWLGTTEGAAFFDGRIWQQYTSQDGLASNHVLHLALTSDSVWFVTTGGISRLRP